ncbi:hypothetical protein DCCM_3652 [Desulfocucumis palustris]|uniref:Uncharacterized protein n=1 Tax=Desulfocucumis palustris TaxID=1898651 RepID=A0A2L2XFQ0_9FIRM|nr:hypothetical protein DCCM_3652 [Desulfocucumis palustris]
MLGNRGAERDTGQYGTNKNTFLQRVFFEDNYSKHTFDQARIIDSRVLFRGH